MPELLQIVSLWKKAQARNEATFLATVVQVSGSSYRKPGARMLVTAAGERAGSISGGCLEAEVARRIPWLTRSGPVVHRYDATFDEDGGGIQYGLGCGGTIWVLMEPAPQATLVLQAIERAAAGERSLVVIAGMDPEACGTLAIADEASTDGKGSAAGLQMTGEHLALAQSAGLHDRFLSAASGSSSELPRFVYMPVSPPPRLVVFGAGQDAQPLVSIAAELGWRVEVADARTSLLRRERFPGAAAFRLLPYGQSAEGAPADPQPLANGLVLQKGDLAVLLTHSYEMDLALLRILLPQSLSYLGILGPLHRTRHLLRELAPGLGLSVEEGLRRLHAPVGFDLGIGDSSTIALAIVSEMQACLAGTNGSVERVRD